MKSVAEWSSEFDILYNNIMSNQAPGLTEYEKSVCLTRAQNDLVRSYFSANMNEQREGFDSSTVRQSDFNVLLSACELAVEAGTPVIDSRAILFTYPEDSLFNLHETLRYTSDDRTVMLQGVRLSYEQYTRLMSKPYKYPQKDIAWILTQAGRTAEVVCRIPEEAVPVLMLRYIRKPKPIVLVSLEDDGITLEGESGPMTCELPEHLHEDILSRAVLLAKSMWVGATER